MVALTNKLNPASAGITKRPPPVTWVCSNSQFFWVIPRLIAVLTPLKCQDIITAYRTPLITTFATGKLLELL